jgi:hypothetical protein
MDLSWAKLFKQGNFSSPRYFSPLTSHDLRRDIISTVNKVLDDALADFQHGFPHLSLDAATFHRETILDFILLRADRRTNTMDFVLYELLNVSEATHDRSRSATLQGHSPSSKPRNQDCIDWW